MADIFEQALGRLSAGRVLDVATGEGGFVQLLADKLGGYAEIVGIDDDEAAIEAARGNLNAEEIRFLQMDGTRLGLRDACFDTVTISASLHHLADVPAVLAEVTRVLRRGGHLVLAEMHRDGQSGAQRTMIALHHWIADVALALGMVHNRTFGREELVAYAESVGLCDMTCYDAAGVEPEDISPADPEPDPMDEAVIRELEAVIDRSLQQAAKARNYEQLRRRGEELRQRLHKTGVQPEPVVVIVGERE